MTYHGHIENGHVVLDGGVNLPEGTPVVVSLVQLPEKQQDREIPTLYERLKPIIGIAKDLPPDASQNIDHYLYGHPKEVKPVFADTSFYAACLSPRDTHHSLAIELSTNNKATIITTEFVLIELANFYSKLARRAAAISLIHQVRGDPDTIIVPASSELMQRGFDLFSRRPDKEWSLTDCVSFVVMEEHGIAEALTSDGDFEQAGFKALLR